VSLFKDYILERTEKQVLETDTGFAVYSYPDETTVYIEDIYIDKTHRQSHYASQLANNIIELAKLRGCTKMIGTVVPSAKNSTISLKVLLGYGMELKSAGPDLIVMGKDI